MRSLPDDQLRMVRNKIAAGWAPQWSATNNQGLPTDPGASDACAWCMYGAAQAADVHPEELALKLGFQTPKQMVDWNDAEGRTQEQVLERIDNALGN